MPNKTQNADQPPFNLPQDEPPEDDLTFGQYLRQIAHTAAPTLRIVVMIAPLVLVLVVIVLALTGPSIGNVFSNIVSEL